MELTRFLSQPRRCSTAIVRVTWPCKGQGRHFIAGAIPSTCCDPKTCNSYTYATEDEALAAILADPWIQDHPEQPIQRADCSIVKR